MSETPPPNEPGVSLMNLVFSLGPAALSAAVLLTIFVILRKTHKRFYAPRTYLGTLREQERTPALPTGLFNWVGAAMKIPDTHALQHQSLDSYLFLRFLRMTVVIMFVGCCITWPILFPIYITGGGEGTELDLLSMANINKDKSGGKYRYFGSVGAAMLFFGFILAMITREHIFYINLRQAFLLSPTYANRISSRTVLFTSVPTPYLDEHKLRKVFGESVRRVWITGDTKTVDELVEERDTVALKLEAAEVKLIKLANAERNKAIKNGAADVNDNEPIVHGDAESGAIVSFTTICSYPDVPLTNLKAARWIPHAKRPTHKLGKFGLYGKKVDSIDWCRERLATLIPEADAAQAAYRAGETKKVGGVFIEFATQADAQGAFQILSHHQALHMAPRYIGVNPNEVVWKSQAITWWHRVIRRLAVVGFITAMIVFWAIPVGIVGIVSKVSYLQEISFLTWIKQIPTPILGIISGILPSVALAILMALVPIIMRSMHHPSNFPQ